MTLRVENRSAEVSAEVSLVQASGLFDAAFYQSRLGQPVPDPIAHYLAEGEAKGIPPSELFDPNFYRLTNPDVVDAGAALLLHYIRHGRNEGRYPTWHALSLDAAKLKQSGLLDASAKSSPRWMI